MHHRIQRRDRRWCSSCAHTVGWVDDLNKQQTEYSTSISRNYSSTHHGLRTSKNSAMPGMEAGGLTGHAQRIAVGCSAIRESQISCTKLFTHSPAKSRESISARRRRRGLLDNARYATGKLEIPARLYVPQLCSDTLELVTACSTAEK